MRCCGGVRVGRPTSRREAPPDDRLRETFDRTGGCLMGFSRAQPTSLKGIGMKTTGFQRPAAAVFAGAALAATIAAFALGLAHAQTVNPVPPPPPPTFNPSTPNTVPQAPYVPVAPSAPSSPSVSAPRRVRRLSRRRHRSRRKRPIRPPRRSPLYRDGTPSVTAGVVTAGAGATPASTPSAC